MGRVAGWVAVLMFGCAAGTTAHKLPPQPETVSAPRLETTTPPQPPPSEYTPIDSALDNGRLYFGGQGRAVVAGVRVGTGGVLGEALPEEPLYGGTTLPLRLGGGFLFWNANDLYHAETFTGTLVPVGSLPRRQRISRASFAEDIVLLHFIGHGRMAWSKKDGTRALMPEPGLIDVALLDDGRGAMLREPNEFWVRPAGARSFERWKDPRLEVRQLSMASSALLVVTEPHQYNTLSAEGNLVPLGANARPLANGRVLPKDPSWTFTETPRERAFQEGVSVGPNIAVIPVRGAFARVDLSTGGILSLSHAIVPGTEECRLLPMEDDVVAICNTSDSATVVIRGLLGPTPQLERRFPTQTMLYAGEKGTLLRVGRCNDKPAAADSATLCIRNPKGEWTDLNVPTGAIPGEITTIRWVPTIAGGAVGIVYGPTPGLVEATTGTFTAYPAAEPPTSRDAFRNQTGLVSNDVRCVLGGDCFVYTTTGSLRLTRKGTVEVIQESLGQVSFHGPNALGTDNQNRLWQSTDHGETWQNVAPPPGHPSIRHNPLACSHVGCRVGDWFRDGYPPSRAQRRLYSTSPQSPLSNPTHFARLDCTPTAKAAWKVIADSQNEPDKPPHFASWFGARRQQLSANWVATHGADVDRFQFVAPEAVSSSLTLADTLLDFEYSEPSQLRRIPPRRLRYRVPFTQPQILETTVEWGVINRVYADGDSEASILQSGLSGVGLPILASEGRGARGLFLSNNQDQPEWGMWLRDKQLPTFGLLQPLEENGSITSVMSLPDGTLAVLEGGNRHPKLYQLAAGTPTLVSAHLPTGSTPPRHDAAAVGPNGEPAILRFWSKGPPTADDPALAFTSNRPPESLAPWSTLTAGPCSKGSGYRAILNVESDWLVLTMDGTTQKMEPGLMALVNWDREAVCLEAVELPYQVDDNRGQGDALHMVLAQFTEPPTATRYRFDVGEEFVQPHRCTLVSQ